MIDWRDLANYPDVDGDPEMHPPQRWRWEFIRRNPEYEADRSRWNAAVTQARAELGEDETPARPAFDPELSAWREHDAVMRPRRRAVAAMHLDKLRRKLADKWSVMTHWSFWPASMARLPMAISFE